MSETDSTKNPKEVAPPEEPAAFEKDIKRTQRVRNLWYLNPIELAGEFWDFVALWRKTRDWRAISIIIPPLLLLGTLGGFILAGKLKSRDALRAWYKKQAFEAVGLDSDGQMKTSEAPAVARTPEEEAKIELLFKRILQLGNEDQDARYFVAWNNARLGKTAAARATMVTLAPKDQQGLDLAHAWLAEDLYQRSIRGEPISIDELEHHLSHAVASDRRKYSPLMYALYAKILEQRNQIDKAASVLAKGAEKDPQLALEPTLIYARHGMQIQAKIAADSVISALKKSLAESNKTKEESSQIALTIARGFQLTNRPDDSIPVLQEALKKDSSEPNLRRALSDAYRLKFRASLNNANGKGQVVIDFLNAAIVADPSNPDVQSELVILRQLGITTGESNLNQLRILIAQKGASHTARLLLAEAGLMSSEFANALAHYEVVLAELPNMVIALNNSSMICLKLDPPDVDKAKEYISRAIAAAPAFAELYDSQGDVFDAAKEPERAIESYSAALAKSPERVETRNKLIAMYRSQGNETEANKQQESLKVLLQKLEAMQQAQKSRSATGSGTNNTPTDALPVDSEKGKEPTAGIPSQSVPNQQPANIEESDAKK